VSRWIPVLAALGICITGAGGGCTGCSPKPSAAPAVHADCEPGKICVNLTRGLMGNGDAVCALDASRRFLDVKLVADCPTTAPLILTVGNADPYDSEFLPVREQRPETLSANRVLQLRTNEPLKITSAIKQLRLAAEARCVERDAVNMRYGDAFCDVPPAAVGR
jgi:hypothetical protein